ncbi:E3 ubiquitin-protein ligase Siah1-like [Centruroides vittatus]|uniref:E3 ubiquitin-protein ligase Siah1-like n=1 Tax=Centruroides vittatus TaxID=120091 RepID=UPI0035108595
MAEIGYKTKMEKPQLDRTAEDEESEGTPFSSSTTDPALTSLLQCPVCYVSPLIYQCVSGHLTCSNYKRRVHRCPTCRGFLGEFRNIAIEKVAEASALPCRFKDNGCLVVRTLTNHRLLYF